MFTFNKPSTCSLYSNRGDRNMHAFRVRYCCLIIAFYGFFTFLMLCLYMKHASDDMDYDHRRRLARIVTETCTAITRRLCVFLDDRNQVGGRAAWKIPRIQNVLEHEFLHFPVRKWLELSIARNCGILKQWFVGKVPGNYRKTCAHKDSVPSLVPEYKV